MELLLKKNVDKLGRIGDIVKVKEGYARNYLLPTFTLIFFEKLARVMKMAYFYLKIVIPKRSNIWVSFSHIA